MFELQGDFRAFLRQAAVFEGIGELVRLADAHQKLRLGNQFLRPHPVFLRGGGERGEVYIGGDVLFAGSFIWIGAEGVPAQCFQGSSMAAGELFFAGVAVVDSDEESVLDVGGDAMDVSLRGERHFDALVGVGS